MQRTHKVIRNKDKKSVACHGLPWQVALLEKQAKNSTQKEQKEIDKNGLFRATLF